MSNEFDFNLDDILAEFGAEESAAVKDHPETPETPETPERRQRESAGPPAEKPEEKPEKKEPVKKPEKEPAPKKKISVKEPAPKKKAPGREPAGRQTAGVSAGVRIGSIVLLILALCFCLVNVHPGAELPVRETVQEPAATLAPVQTAGEQPPEGGSDETAAEIAETVEAEPVAEEKWKVIPVGQQAGPAANADCFGEIELDNAADTLDIIQQARDSGLLGQDERVVFDPDVEFNRGSHTEPIMYYLDDSLMVICWKELIDGNTCTFSEIKIRDGSQFRKKVVGDINSTNETDYLTSIAEGANAVVAFGADKFKARPEGIVIQDGVLYRYNDAVRTGAQKMYNSLDNLLVTASGDFIFTHRYEEFSREQLEQTIAEKDVIFSLAFGPLLIENGVLNEEYWPVDLSTEYAVGQIFDPYSRAGIAQVSELHYLYMSLNHSDEKTARWTMEEFAKHFAEKDVINAYALDGGQTSETVFNNYIYSYIDHNNERLTSDAIYFCVTSREDG